MIALLTQNSDVAATAGAGIAVLFFVLIMLALVVVYLAAMWKVFEKMGQPGWVGIIPILNVYVIFRLSGREWWYLLLFLVPCINIIASWLVADDLAKLFGKDTIWSIVLFLFGPVGYLLIGFGGSQYVGPREQIV